MLLGGDSLGMVPFGFDRATDFSVLSDYQLLDADPTQRARYRVEAFPYDPDTAAVVPLKYAQIDAEIRLTEDAYPTRVEEALNYSALIVQGEITARIGSAPNYGTMRVIVAPNEGDSDEFERFYWDNRPVHVYRGFDALPANQWLRVLSANALGINIGLNGFTIELRDPSLRLQNPIQSAKYLGTGGLDGGEDLLDQRKPVCFGSPNNITPRVVDRVFNVYQWHDGVSTAVRAVRDKGIVLTNAGNVTDVYAWTPVVGQYVTDLSESVLRLGGVPAGLITMDVDGHTDGTTFAKTTATIVETILRDYAGFVDIDLDLPSFAKLKLENPTAAHYYQQGGDTSSISVISELLDDILGFWTFNPLGQFEVGQLRSEPPALTVQPEELYEPFSSQRSPTPIHTRTIEYARSYTVQNADALAGGVDTAVADFVGQEYRTQPATTALPERKGAIESVIQTNLEDEPAGSVALEASRQLALVSGNRRAWNLRIKGHPGQIRMGRSVRIKFPRFRFTSGRNGIVLGVQERSSDESTQIVWWG